MNFNTAILLITFNRPEHTRRVFEAVKLQKPNRLFVFQDGERDGNQIDNVNCKAVRAIFEESIDWPCEFYTNYSPVNLGCGKGPSTGISWFFEHVEQGIILEDDCLPHPDFFGYSELMLEKYKNNSNISLIAGSSFQDQSIKHIYSYYFGSGSFGTWGWATWKRSWLNFEYYVDSIDKQEMNSIIRKYFKEIRQRRFWKFIFSEVKKNRFNETCWDYQFYFSCWKHNMLAIIPYTNLITNIGYDEMATHTDGTNHPAANKTTQSIFPLSHPDKIKLNIKSDFYVHRNYNLSYEYGWQGFKRIPVRINRWFKNLIGHTGSWK